MICKWYVWWNIYKRVYKKYTGSSNNFNDKIKLDLSQHLNVNIFAKNIANHLYNLLKFI